MLISVRPFTREDVPQVLALMRELAVFENYIDGFRVTEQDLIDHGLGAAPRFGVLVADEGGEVAGIAVHYTIPWTYDLRPALVLKELFVRKESRRSGAGKALFQALEAHARSMGASQIRWTVLAENAPAKRFYAAFGGKMDPVWEPWILDCTEPGRVQG